MTLDQRGIDRRRFLSGAVGLAGAGVLAACGSGSGSGGGASPTPSKNPPIGAESGKMSILEWGGYEASGTKAQTYGLKSGADYTKKFGASGITYSYIQDDDQALNKATQTQFDIMHPCNENVKDYIDRGLVQPWDTSLLPSFSQLNPDMVKVGQSNGHQYFIP
ncbi:MAG TPA: hypothetical protein VEM41_09675, partial [Actinomycetota bacterium]|nr:hypothetical protein [Actinomycetota bacterium]